MSKFIEYAQHLNASPAIKDWIVKRMTDTIDTTEGEHVIDYLVAINPKLTTANYDDTKHNAEKWVKTLEKKGEHIKETAEDTKVVLDFKDGFKIVQLIGKNAYEREGYLMHHCVASYYGKSAKIYSLRDEKNIPHCTMEQDQQVKGKGNGDIHPKYVGYVVAFLKHIGMTVGDSEMRHLGYISAEKFLEDLGDETKKQLYNKKYLPKNARLFDTDGKEFATLDILDQVPLISEVESELKVNFELPPFIKLCIDFVFKKKTTKDGNVQANAGDYAKLAASGHSAKLAASGHSAQLAASGDSAKLAASGHSAQLAASGDYAKLAASGDSAQLAASGDSAKLAASGHSAQLAASGDYAKLAASGDSAQLAASGHSAQLAASGDYAKLAASGDSAQLAASGDSAQLAASGDYAKLAASGDSAQLAASGHSAKLAASGHSAQLALVGNDSVGAAIGYKNKIKAKKGCWITLAEYDEEYKPICVKSAIIDGKKLKEDVWYELKKKKFVEVK